MVPVTEYLNTTYRPDRDYVDGEVLERNVGEYEHSRPQGLIAALLFSQEKERRIIVLIAQRLQVGPNRFRVADVCVLRADAPYEPREGLLEATDGVLRTSNPELAVPLNALFD
jgi:Uma2 family endonuclease